MRNRKPRECNEFCQHAETGRDGMRTLSTVCTPKSVLITLFKPLPTRFFIHGTVSTVLLHQESMFSILYITSQPTCFVLRDMHPGLCSSFSSSSQARKSYAFRGEANTNVATLRRSIAHRHISKPLNIRICHVIRHTFRAFPWMAFANISAFKHPSMKRLLLFSFTMDSYKSSFIRIKIIIDFLGGVLTHNLIIMMRI